MTKTNWNDRLLGTNDEAALTVDCTSVANGNRPSLSAEMARRSVLIRIDAKVEHPEFRGRFRIPDLRRWVTNNRSRLLAAGITLVEAWRQEGKPLFTERSMGSFESWAQVMGGILTTAGVSGFLESQRESTRDFDFESLSTQCFIEGWRPEYGSGRVGVAGLFELAEASELDLGGGELRSRQTKLGVQLRRLEGRVFTVDGVAVTVRIEQGAGRALQYRLEESESGQEGTLC